MIYLERILKSGYLSEFSGVLYCSGALRNLGLHFVEKSLLSGQEFLGENPEDADEDSISGCKWQ